MGRFFTEELLEKWQQIPVIIEEYPYVGMDYRWDLEMPQPLGGLGTSWYVYVMLFHSSSYID